MFTLSEMRTFYGFCGHLGYHDATFLGDTTYVLLFLHSWPFCGHWILSTQTKRVKKKIDILLGNQANQSLLKLSLQPAPKHKVCSWQQSGIHPRKFTLPETNIAPEHRPPKKETSTPTIHFQGQTVSFEEGNISPQELPSQKERILSQAPFFRGAISRNTLGHPKVGPPLPNILPAQPSLVDGSGMGGV